MEPKNQQCLSCCPESRTFTHFLSLLSQIVYSYAISNQNNDNDDEFNISQEFGNVGNNGIKLKMEVDHCGNWVTKRNLNLENFLRQLDKDFGFPR